MNISDAEWDVMTVIWTKEPRTASQVIESLSSTHQWNHRTIRTLLARLVEKGALTYDVSGTKYNYRAVVSQHECVRKRSDSFLSKVFGGDVGALVAHFVEGRQLSPSEAEALTKLLESSSQRKSKKGKRS